MIIRNYHGIVKNFKNIGGFVKIKLVSCINKVDYIKIALFYDVT